MKKDGRLITYDGTNKKEVLEITKILNWFSASIVVKETDMIKEKDKPQKGLFVLSDNLKIDWMVYELSKLSFMSAGSKTNWARVFNTILFLVPKLVPKHILEQLDSDIFKELTKEKLRNRANHWKKYCLKNNLNKDFYSTSKTTHCNSKSSIIQVSVDKI